MKNRIPLGTRGPAWATVLAALICSLPLAACSTVLFPQYAPHTEAKLGGSALLGSFSYRPYDRGALAANQLNDSTVGDVLLSEDVSTFVRHAVASELRAAGVDVTDDAPYVVAAQVERFDVGTLGFRVEWEVTIRLRITRKSNNSLLFEAAYTGSLSHGKMMTFEGSQFPGAVVAKAIGQFLDDPRVHAIFRRGRPRA
jgi:hypothetical protein